eukprot:TRINITY_DN2794_c1_g1_i1.p1 TRINITY_DN2794_c1_g1~~TRINITY_DN2794_c1_g1_i1.p1  ORF type:complete len:457 (-),score=79.51 TRINITY_DN2794_c1_g1_i1:105-1475(-)
MIESGMDVARLNFSHGTHEDHLKYHQTIRNLSGKMGKHISTMCDIQGPKIRTGRMEEPFTLSIGDRVDVTHLPIIGNNKCFQIQYDTLLDDLDEDDVIFLNDGKIKLTVVKKNPQSTLTCRVDLGGVVSNMKGCNMPSGNIKIDVLTPKDEIDLKFISSLNPDYVAASFVGNASDVHRVRDYLKQCGNENVKIISKIERPIAVEKIDEIIDASDGIMVARGDLGVEIDGWLVPEAQKIICSKTNKSGKPVIVATQMLESMTNSTRPTRAEISDVYNAVLDRADAVMLSGETSSGKYPVETVRLMNQIVDTAEKKVEDVTVVDTKNNSTLIESIAYGVYQMGSNLKRKAKMVVISTKESKHVNLAQVISKYRSSLDVIFVTDDMTIANQSNLLWGVVPIRMDNLASRTITSEQNNLVVKLLMSRNIVDNDDLIIFINTNNGISLNVWESEKSVSMEE